MNWDSFCYLRHGQSHANFRGVMCGRRCDSRLTEVGRKQARQAGLILSRTSIIKSICASPQHRAQETARIVGVALSIPVTTIDELAEWDVGAWDHQPFKRVREDFLGTTEPPGGETRSAFARRVETALKKCVMLDHSPVLLVSHGSVWITIQRLLGLQPVRSENAVPYKVQREIAGWSVTNLSAEM
jgi:broad specificity phosphatase PhoE